MGGRRRKAYSTGVTPIGGRAIKSRRIARIVTSSFHDITRALRLAEEALTNANEDTRSELERRVTNLKSDLVEMGGRNKYQEASIISTKHHQTSKWFVQSIKALCPFYRDRAVEQKLRLLEVGAINTQLLKVPWLNVRAIDINSQHPDIEELDFFDLTPEPIYDFIVSSMVVNCVPEPAKRGEMLARLCACLRRPLSESDTGGVLFLVLPMRFVAGCNCGKCLRKQFTSGKKNLGIKIDRCNEATTSLDGGGVVNIALEAFLLMLEVCGLVEVVPRRETPKLMFLTLARRRKTISDDVPSLDPHSWMADCCINTKAELEKKILEFRRKFDLLPCCVCHQGCFVSGQSSKATSDNSLNLTTSSSSTKLSSHCVKCGRVPCASIALTAIIGVCYCHNDDGMGKKIGPEKRIIRKN